MEAPIGGHSPRLQSLPDSKGTGDWTPGTLGKGLDFPREGSGAGLHGMYLWGHEAGGAAGRDIFTRGQSS